MAKAYLIERYHVEGYFRAELDEPFLQDEDGKTVCTGVGFLWEYVKPGEYVQIDVTKERISNE